MNNQQRLDQIKAEIRTLGQELENIVSMESIAMRLILKNILEIAEQLDEPTFAEKMDEFFKLFLSTSKAIMNGNNQIFEGLTELASKKYLGLTSISWRKENMDYDTKRGIMIEMWFDNDL